MGVMRIINGKGDSPVPWDVEDKISVEDAKRQFDELIAQNFAGFDISSGERVHEFPIESEKVVVIPPMAGG